MKALVTGGAGFIGSYVVEAYLAGGIDVAIVDDLSRGRLGNLAPQARFYQVDIRDQAALEDVFAREKPDVVNHQAAQIDVRRSVAEPAFDAESNILGSINLLGLAVKHKCQRFVFASTGGAIYGEPKVLPATEEAPVRPLAPYGISKLTVERYLFSYNAIYGIPYVVLRYGNVYGPRQSSEGEAGVVAIFSEQIMAGVTPTVYGDGSKTRDYVEVSDVARANVQALKRGDNEIFNIATGLPTSDYQIFADVRHALGATSLEPSFTPKRPCEVVHIHLDVSKAKFGLNWEPQVPIAEGVRRTTEWFKRKQALTSEK
jgi:UDP-glucose 4-epimerase